LPDYFGLATTKFITIFTSSGNTGVPGITTASMTPVLYRDGVSANAASSMASVGKGIYSLFVSNAENSADHVDLVVIVSATAADGFLSWDNSHDVVDAGSASAGTANSITLANTTRYSNTNGPAQCVIEILEGSASPDTRLITAYASATRVATVADSWSSAEPGTTSRYQIRRHVLTNQAFPSNFASQLIAADGRQEVNIIEVASVSASIEQFIISNASVSAAVKVALDNASATMAAAVWNVSGTEPTVPITWSSANRGQMQDWAAMRDTNRHTQSSTEMEVLSSAGAVVASASTNLTSSSANRDQFLG